MVWSLIPYAEKLLNKLVQKNLFPMKCHEKLLEKGHSILYGRSVCPFSFNIFREVLIKTCKFIEFDKKKLLEYRISQWIEAI